jgi:hypothetical protein
MRKIFFALILLAITSCSRKSVSVPDNVIGETEMTELLTDLSFAQSEMTQRMRSDRNLKMDDYVETVLRKHKIERKQFLESLKFYSANPDLLDIIYDSVLVKMNNSEIKLNSL